ncbi:MAG: chorismate mutase [Terriglobia bacterium]
MDIEDWRRRIDEIDRELVKLLNARSQAAVEIGRLKRQRGLPLYQPEREAEILAAVERLNGGPLDNKALRRLFERILDEARRVEHQGYRRPDEPGSRGKKSE